MGQEEANRFAFGSKSLVLWVTLLSVSGLVLLYAGDLVSLTTWILLLIVVCVPALLYHYLNFKRRAEDLLTQGVSLQPYSYTRQIRLIAVIAILGFGGLVAPLILSGFISADIWLGSLVGVLDGWLTYLTLFTVYVWIWERRHLGVLYRFEVWDGRSVTHVGLKFQKRSSI